MAAGSAPARLPFYPTITPVRETFTDAAGKAASVDLPLVTLPPGTLLFRTIKMPIPGYEYDDIRNFYRDYLGSAEVGGSVCMSPIHNTFFYPFPYVGFGIHTVGKTFTGIQLSVLVHPVNVVACVSPSSFVRGMGQRYSGNAPWIRCDSFGADSEVHCHRLTYSEEEALRYDNCLNPEYQVKSGTRGWMAIADLDSVNPRKKRFGETKPMPMKESPMGDHIIRLLRAGKTNQANELLLNLYTDDHRHAGFPEIVLYPYKTHQGSKPIRRPCKKEEDAIILFENEAKQNNFNYLPLATITEGGVTDMVNGFFVPSRTGIRPAANRESWEFTSSDAQRAALMDSLEGFLEKLRTEGINLPFYGQSKLSFDTRTGFYVFKEMIPLNLRIKVPEDILQEEAREATPGNANRKAYEHELYRNLTMPMFDDEDRKRVLSYQLRFRGFLPNQFMKRYPLGEGYAKRRAMIFNRYPVLKDIATGLEISLPPEWSRDIAQAAKLYVKETGKKPRPRPVEEDLPSDTLHITGLAPGTTIEELIEVFGKFDRLGIQSSRFVPPSSAFLKLSSPTAKLVATHTDRKVRVNGVLVNVAAVKRTGTEGNAAAGAAAAMANLGGHTPPLYAPTSPAYIPSSPAYGGVTPLYGAAAAGGEGSPPYGVATPEGAGAGAAQPSPLAIGGGRRKTKQKKQKKVRKTRKTRLSPDAKIHKMAKKFASVWNIHAAQQRRTNSTNY